MHSRGASVASSGHPHVSGEAFRGYFVGCASAASIGAKELR